MDALEERVIETAKYIVATRCTVREAAEKFGVSKSTVHKDVAYRLKDIAPGLYDEVEEVMQYNKAQRHIRGGMATKRMYELKRNRKSL